MAALKSLMTLNVQRKQAVKKIVGILAVLMVAAVVFFVLNNPLNKLVKLAIEDFGQDMVQAEVRVNSVNISATDGKGQLNGLHLGNPEGFRTDHAFRAETIEIEIEPASVTKNVIVLRQVLIDTPSIIYEKGDSGSNFDVIQRNVEAYLGTKGKHDKAEGKKLIIDSFIIRNAKVNYDGKLDLSLPDIELHDIGKKNGGATPAQVTKAIIAELNTQMALSLAKTAAIGAVGGVAIGAGILIKNILGK